MTVIYEGGSHAHDTPLYVIGCSFLIVLNQVYDSGMSPAVDVLCLRLVCKLSFMSSNDGGLSSTNSNFGGLSSTNYLRSAEQEISFFAVLYILTYETTTIR